MRLLKRIREERAFALPLALFTMVIMSMTTVAVIEFSSSSGRTATVARARVSAEALAEAGINNALSILASSSNPTDSALLSPTTVQMAGGSTTYSGVLLGEIWTLTGVGSVPNPTGPSAAPVQRTVTRLVSMNSVSVGSFSGLWDRIYSDATGTCSVTINAGMTIPSNFAAKGDVCLNSSSITGAGTIVDIGGKVTITGSSSSTAAGPNPPSAGTGWTNPTNVYTTNSVYATNVIAGGATGATQDTTGFGFAIPAGATIDGITASIRRHASIGAVSITHDASSSTNASSVSSTSWSHTVANQADRMLVVGVTAENSTSGCQPSGVTYSGQALTQITQNVTSSPYVCVSEWYLSAPPVGTANVVVTFGGTIQYVTAGATSLYNVKQGAPDASNSSFSNTGLTSTSVTTLSPNSWVVDSFGSGQPGALTAGAGQTSRWTQTVGSQAAGGMSTVAVASPGSATMSWTQAGTTGTTNDVLADNPVSYWRLGETSGTSAVDQKGVTNGTYTGGYTLSQTGALSGDSNKAVLLNGTSGKVSLGNPASLQLSSGTVEAWFKTAGGTGGREIFSKDQAWNVELVGGVLRLWDWNAGAYRDTGINVANSAWHHVAVTFQSGVANGTKIYLDGSLVLTTTITVKNQTGTAQIGSIAAGEYFPGTIDEVAVYNTLLSATRIQTHYAGDNRTAHVVAAFAPAASGLVDSNVVLLKGGAPAGSNYADTGSIWGTTDATIAYGTSADLWGTTWTAAEVNASNFGVRFSARNVGSASTTASLDSITVTVSYVSNVVGGIGTTGPIARANIAGTCKYNAQVAHTPCSATDHVWASTITTSPTNLTRPTINWSYWYANANPGPMHPCTTTSGTPPAFDSNSTYDGGNAEKELTPEGAGASYTCQAKDAGGNIIGELSWNVTTRVLTIKGTIFFDGNAVFHTHDAAAWHYHGRGVIYISRNWHNDEPACAGSATTDCRTNGMPTWDTNTDLLVLVIGGKNTPGSNDFDFHRNNSAFQGAIYSVNTCNIRETAYMQGPLNCGAYDFGGDSPSFFAWPPLPNSATGQIYSTGTDSDVQLVVGVQTG